MSQSIFKYPLQITDRQQVLIPSRPEILAVKMQGDQLCLWAMVDPEAEPVSYLFHVIGTGQPVTEEPLKHIGTVLDGNFVWHVFSEGPHWREQL